MKSIGRGLRRPRVQGLFIWGISLLYLLFQGGKTSSMLFAMSSVFVGYLLLGGYSGMSRAVGKRQLTLGNGQFDLLHAGEQMNVTLNVNIPGYLPFPYIILREVLKKHNGQSWSFEESVISSFRGQARLVFKTPPFEHGRYHFMNTDCVSEDIFGLLEHKGSIHAPGQFRVLPRTVLIPYWQLLIVILIMLDHRHLFLFLEGKRRRLTVYVIMYTGIA